MKRYFVIALIAAAPLVAQPRQQPQQQQQVADVPQRVHTDALVLDRVGEASKRDLPADLLRRIVTEDIELLRGRRADGSYDYATWERFEAGRITSSFSVEPRGDEMETLEVKGANVYRVIIDVPTRKLLVRKNRPIWIERVDLEYVGEGSTQTERRTVDVKGWLQPGEVRPIDIPAIARQATARVIATTDEKGGYGNVSVALAQARIVDSSDSPYGDAVVSAKAALRALDNNDVTALRASAQRLRDSLRSHARSETGSGLASSVTVTAPRVTASGRDTAERVELQAELQLIEDLLTGSESERREGLDRLHQLIRRVRQ